jgi:predicted ATPase
LQVKNFKSLRDVDIELGKKNVLVGANMSGKSNLLDCLKFLSHVCLNGVTKALLDRGGFHEVAWKGDNPGPISFRLIIEQGETKATKRTYEYEISIIGSPTGLISIERERLTFKTDREVSTTLIDLRNGLGKLMHADGSVAFTATDAGRSALEYEVPGWEGMEVKGGISRWRFYHLIPAAMKQVGHAVAQRFLTQNGDNFSSWLMTLQTGHPEEFRLMKQAAKDSLPGLEEILSPPTQFATTYVLTREHDLRQPVSIWNMSDGEIIFLAWLSLTFAPPELGAPLFCVEELENHLHPRLLETLVEVVNQRQNELGSQAAQTIVTTHSPYLVDKVSLDELVVFEKSHGATICTRPASKKHLRELLEREELGLGELWYSGALQDKS